MKTHIARAFVVLFAALLFTAGACSLREQPPRDGYQPPPPRETSAPEATGPEKKVRATYYGAGDGFAGKKTASGERFDPSKKTAAHRSLPFGTKVQVENPDTGKSVEVEINDRGPFSGKSQLDLSYGAAKELGMTEKGASTVKMKVLGKDGAKGSSGAPAERPTESR